jgi:predicted nucleic-acid-binding Zn-ribbon protein
MKKTLQCPKCEGREIWRIEQMLERGHGSRPEPFAVMLEPAFWTGSVPHGTFEAFICKACGYTEWYAKNIEFLREDPANGVHLIVNDSEKAGPYR